MVANRSDRTTVTRISASEDTPAGEKQPVSKSKPARTKKVAKVRKSRSLGPLGGFFGYFKGAWAELRQVHWPTRRATWGLTGAVLLFSGFFVIFITALDAVFKFIFERILGS